MNMNHEFVEKVQTYIDKYRAENSSHHSQEKKENSSHNDNMVKGIALTKEGPAAYPETGNILDYPELLWSEDKWDEKRIEMSKEKLKLQGATLSEHWKSQYVNRAGAYWHKFYKRNSDNFYKDRHYLHIVFPELAEQRENGRLSLFEIGCGVGNAFIPLLEINPTLTVVAVDFAKSAIDIIHQNFDESHPLVSRFTASVCDIVNDEFPVTENSMDLVLCFFVLSAIAPEAHEKVFAKVYRVLKPGGKLLFRDYGRYDEAQLRFGKGSKLDENFYVRQDGTCAYYFDKLELEKIAVDQGFVVEENDYILRQYANRQQKVARNRVWIHSKFVKSH